LLREELKKGTKGPQVQSPSNQNPQNTNLKFPKHPNMGPELTNLHQTTNNLQQNSHHQTNQIPVQNHLPLNQYLESEQHNIENHSQDRFSMNRYNYGMARHPIQPSRNPRFQAFHNRNNQPLLNEMIPFQPFSAEGYSYTSSFNNGCPSPLESPLNLQKARRGQYGLSLMDFDQNDRISMNNARYSYRPQFSGVGSELEKEMYSPTKFETAEEEDGKTRLEREVLDLVDNDESNNYSPKNNGSQICTKVFSSENKTYSKSQKGSKSFQHGDLKQLNDNLEEEKADHVPEMLLREATDLTDDATLEEIFMSDLSLYKTSDQRKSKGNSLRESTGEISGGGRFSLNPKEKNNGDRYSMGHRILRDSVDNRLSAGIGNRHSLGLHDRNLILDEEEKEEEI